MSIQTRREREKQDMKTAILEAATKIIINEGYDKLSMRKLADAIEYTPTTLYNYYEDKAQIIDAIMRKLNLEVICAVKAILQENKSLPVNIQIGLAFKVFINVMANNAEMGKAVMRSGTKAIFGSDEEPEQSSSNGINLLHTILQEGQNQYVLRKLDENASWMLISALLGFSMNAIENQLYLSDNWDSLVDTYIEILINGIMPINSINEV
ncbi:MAG: TetR/AcrR family transcriptional regulator [Defluviitaleaceae bacterium]|nr:TetR/AcrR family transcriptional regulator [Defluviitaleaceae bacterium]